MDIKMDALSQSILYLYFDQRKILKYLAILNFTFLQLYHKIPYISSSDMSPFEYKPPYSLTQNYFQIKAHLEYISYYNLYLPSALGLTLLS